MKKTVVLPAFVCVLLGAVPSWGAELSLASSDIGGALALLRGQLDRFEASTGHRVELIAMPDSTTDQFAQYKVTLAAQSDDVDVLMTDVVWAPQLAQHFEDLSALVAGREREFFPEALESQKVDGRLVALPLFVSAPALFYRKDLLEKYDASVPTTWSAMTTTAKAIMDAERLKGRDEFWGYVFQGSAYEGLTCNALEWVKSSGGGDVINSNGEIDFDLDAAAEALELAGSWIGTISPDGVLGYQEEESRGVWQLGNAAFMRNWPYAQTLGNFDDSPVKGQFDIAPLPHGESGESSPTLGGWNVAVSKYSDEVDAAKELAAFLVEEDNQVERLATSGDLPTLLSLYENAEVLAAHPSLEQWLPILHSAKARPAAALDLRYNEVSAAIWAAAHDALTTPGSARQQLEALDVQLQELGR